MAPSEPNTNGTVSDSDVRSAVNHRRRAFRMRVRAARARSLLNKRPRGERQQATQSSQPFRLALGTIVPPPDHELSWRMQSLDTNTLSSASPSELVEYLADLSPELSKGIWDYQRLLNPGWTYEVVTPGTDTPSASGKAIVDEFFDRLKRKHGSADVVFGRLHMGAYMRGGYFAELELDDFGREALDIATPDPSTVRFKVIAGDDGKKRLQMGQWQDGAFVPLDEYETVSYVPIDAMPDRPYGRPLVAPALFSALFLIGLLHDLRRVISQQGWPRLDIAINVEKLLGEAEQSLDTDSEEYGNEADDEKVAAKIEQAIDQVRQAYSALEPDDAWIHGDEVEIKGPIGVTGSANLNGVGAIIEVVERMLVRALKTMPLMLGMTDGVSEANANRQWEITIAGIKAMQHLCESVIERFLELACRVRGVRADVQFKFAEIRAAEAQRDALTYSQQIDNQTKLRDEGYIDQDEAAQSLVGHPPAADGPLREPVETDAQDNDENPNPGETKTKADGLVRRVPTRHDLRPLHLRSASAYRDAMIRTGWTYTGSVVLPPEIDAQNRSGLSGVAHHVEVARLVDVATGEPSMIEYDRFERDIIAH